MKPQIRLFESTLLCVAPHLAGAVSAYFLKGVVPEWDLKDIYMGMMQFMGIQVFGLLMIIFFPQITLWLPGVTYGN